MKKETTLNNLMGALATLDNMRFNLYSLANIIKNTGIEIMIDYKDDILSLYNQIVKDLERCINESKKNEPLQNKKDK